MKKALLVIIIALCFLSSAALAQEESRCGAVPEGYVCEEGNGFVTAYNYNDINALLEQPVPDTANGAYAMTHDGVVDLMYQGKDLGKIYGNIVADVQNKKLTITNGGFISPEVQSSQQNAETPIAEGEDLSAESMNFDETDEAALKVNISAARMEIDVSRLPLLQFFAVSAIFTKEDTSIVCRDECKLWAGVALSLSILNVSSQAVIIGEGKLHDYLEGKKVDPKYMADISSFKSISLYSSPGDSRFFSFEGGLSDGIAKVGAIGIQSEEIITFSRTKLGENSYYDSILPIKETSVFTDKYSNMAIVSPSLSGSSNIILKDISVSSKPGIFSSGDLNLKLEKGGIFIVNEIDRNLCLSDQFTCLRRNTGLLSIKPIANPDDNILLTVAYPRQNGLAQLEELKISPFETVIDTAINVKREGKDAVLTFSKSDIVVKNGVWRDVGISFSAYVYDPEIYANNNLVCDLTLNQCFLDGQQVSGIDERRTTSCAEDSECGEGRICGCVEEDSRGRCADAARRCVRQTGCTEMIGFGAGTTAANPLDVLIIPDGYENRQDFLRDANLAITDLKFKSLFSVTPFKEARNKFKFYTVPLNTGYQEFARTPGEGLVPSGLFVNYAKRQCAAADTVIVLSKNRFRAFAYPAETAYIPDILSRPNALVVAHEFGHSFGLLEDEYNQPDSMDTGSTGSPNCLATEAEARRVWNLFLPEQEQVVENLISAARDYAEKGCGGDCIPGMCDSYFRPSENSIMNNHEIPSGETFNNVSRNWLEGFLAKYG